ncbi:MAG: hypothetical protein ACLSB9_29545 [Hydrogeniiclostridium mannosilyticum]
MLRPIPQSLLGDIATIKVCAGIDRYQHAIWDETVVQHVHLQNTNEVKKTRDNTEVVLRSVLFIDGRLSSPALDYDALASTPCRTENRYGARSEMQAVKNTENLRF